MPLQQPRDANSFPRLAQGEAATSLAISLVLLRFYSGLSQEELEGRCSLRFNAISDYERGRIEPGLRTLLRILGALRLPLAALHRCEDFQRGLAALCLPARLAVPGSLEESTAAAEEGWRLQRRRHGLRAEIEALASDMRWVTARFVRLLFLALA